jgi:hypothetical protein
MSADVFSSSAAIAASSAAIYHLRRSLSFLLLSPNASHVVARRHFVPTFNYARIRITADGYGCIRRN